MVSVIVLLIEHVAFLLNSTGSWRSHLLKGSHTFSNLHCECLHDVFDKILNIQLVKV